MADAPEIVTLQVDCRYLIQTAQEALNCGVNSFGVTLLAESLGDNDKLVDGGVLLAFPFDHKHRPVWIIVTAQAPVRVEKAPASEEGEKVGG